LSYGTKGGHGYGGHSRSSGGHGGKKSKSHKKIIDSLFKARAPAIKALETAEQGGKSLEKTRDLIEKSLNANTGAMLAADEAFKE